MEEIKMSVISLLSSSSYSIFNKDIAKASSINAAVLLSVMCSKFEYHRQNGTTVEINGKQYFFFRREDIEEETTLNEKAQVKCCRQLCELGILEIIKHGIPAKNYYTINEDAIEKAIEKHRRIQYPQNGGTGTVESGGTVCSKTAEHISNKNSNSINNNSDKCSAELNDKKINDKCPPAADKTEKGKTILIDAVLIVSAYIQRYKSYLKKVHPRLKEEQRRSVCNQLEEYMDEFGLEIEDVVEMIDFFFNKPPKNCDMNIHAFVSRGIFVRVGYSTGKITGFAEF